MRVILFAVLLALSCVSCGASNLTLSPDQCPQAEALSAAELARVHCGMLTVPENYKSPTGRMIKLAVVVVDPAVPPGDDPVLLLHGGPGGGVTQVYRYWLDAAYGRRKVIAFDQRGVGRSAPAMCPGLGSEFFDISTRGLAPREESKQLAAAYLRCHDDLKSNGFDLTQYNTDTTVADMESLREALGLARWHLYGASYGTTVGLAYLRDHPDQVRSLIINSVLPMDAPEAADAAPNLMRALHQMSSACEAQSGCKTRFGNIEKMFRQTILDLANAPLAIPPARAGDPVVILSASAYISVIHQLLYDSESYPVLPEVMNLVAARDGEALAMLVGGFRDNVNRITHGEEAAVECYERAPFDKRENFLARSSEWPELRDNMTTLVSMLEICAGWKERATHAMKPLETRGSVPLLVVAGSWDPITPPSDSKATADRFGGYYVEIPFMGHGERGMDCSGPIINAFLDNPLHAPDTACLARRQPPVFLTHIVRAPALARVATGIGNNPLAPVSLIMLSLVCVMLSSLALPLIGLYSVARYGPPIWSRVWNKPVVPVALAATTMLVWTGSVAWLLQTSTPLLAAIGLPAGAQPLFALPWAAALLAAWGARLLLKGHQERSRNRYATWYLIFVCLAVVVFLVMLARGDLMVPHVS